jgi:uncharacterized protein
MQLNNEFVVQASASDTWRLLTDLERIAPCMPGAVLTGRDGDDYLGTVKVKVGPIGAHFKGVARFVDRDDATHRASISMSGKDVKGAAAANATLHARLEPVSETATRVYVDTDLDITGRMAQFGRGAIADVSNRLIGQFTQNLGALVGGGVDAPAAAAATPSQNGQPAAVAAPAPATDLNVLSLIAPGAAKQLMGPLLGFAFGWLVARAFPPRRPR